MSEPFKALVVTETADGKFLKEFKERSIEDLPVGEVLVKVCYSALNYKDALSSIGNKGITKSYPHTPGIDVSGIVESSDNSAFEIGNKVIVTGYDLGMNTSGGFAEYIQVPDNWVVPLPENLSLKEAMIYGTAGFTAAMSINALLKHSLKIGAKGNVLVTGSTGGVGTLSIAILKHLGFEVTAVTGKEEAKPFLQALGTDTILKREDIDDQSGRPLLKGLYDGAIDTVGGNTLATVLKSLKYGAAVAACGLVASSNLQTTVFPFILRANAILGIASAECSMDLRLEIWNKLSTVWKPKNLETLYQEISLEEVPQNLELMLAGKLIGKRIVKIS